MTHVVQFTTMSQFINDLAAGDTAAIYHDLIEQRTATGKYGISRWLLATVIRAIVADGLNNGKAITHIAALTIPHGPQIDRLYGRIFGPPGAEDADADRWRDAQRDHIRIIDHLEWRLAGHGLLNTARAGILHVPADLSLVLSANPLDEAKGQTMTLVTPDHPDWGLLQEVLEEQRRAEADAAGEADYNPGGDGSPG